jgi:toxin YoeB
MNNYFFLLNEAIDVDDYPAFKNGMLNLAAIEKRKEDEFLRHETVWALKIIEVFYRNIGGYEEQVICKFIEQMTPSKKYVFVDGKYNFMYPDNLNAFLGINFSCLLFIIEREKRVVDGESFDNAKRFYYSNLQCNGDKNKMKCCLAQLYAGYDFSSEAIEDITYWNQKDFPLYQRIQKLLANVTTHRFQGGMGKTEVLKNQKGIVSKRIDAKHRITYRLKDGIVYILACKGHYKKIKDA